MNLFTTSVVLTEKLQSLNKIFFFFKKNFQPKDIHVTRELANIMNMALRTTLQFCETKIMNIYFCKKTPFILAKIEQNKEFFETK